MEVECDKCTNPAGYRLSTQHSNKCDCVELEFLCASCFLAADVGPETDVVIL